MNKDEVYLSMATSARQASKCPRRGVGALLLNKDGRLKGHGYNGTIAGASNLCGGDVCLRDSEEIESGTRSDVGCIHAEMNLLINSERKDLVGGTIYLSMQPCYMCAKLMAQAGVARVVCWDTDYNFEGIDVLRENGIEVTLL